MASLTNKLGDPSRKVASKAGFLLSQLLLQHPAMKPVVVREVRLSKCGGQVCRQAWGAPDARCDGWLSRVGVARGVFAV